MLHLGHSIQWSVKIRGFFDKAKALGFRIVVQSDCVVGHVDRHVITPNDHITEMQKLQRQQRLAVGLLT